MFEREIKVLRFMQGYGDDLLADIEPEAMCRQPMPGMNHPAWIIGHLAIAADQHRLDYGAEAVLGNWQPLFGFGSKATDDVSAYPAKDVLVAAWHDANERYIAAASGAMDEQLTKPNQGPVAEALPTVADWTTFSMTAHTSLHLGQLSAWRRADGRPALF